METVNYYKVGTLQQFSHVSKWVTHTMFFPNLTLYISSATVLYSQRISTNLLHCIIYLLVLRHVSTS